MLSIIIMSNRAGNFEKIKENISVTVGTPYEIIRIEHIDGGISKGYNAGALLSNFSYLCFVHDDVLFHTNSWGKLIVNHLKNESVGVIGVMGGRYKSAFGLGWRDGRTDFYRFHSKSGLEGGKVLYFNPGDKIKSRVVCLDGVFLCCRKEIWQQYQFDEINFKGFHFYDIDYSFRVAQHFQNFMINDVLLEHFSQGNRDKQFIGDALIFEKIHKAHLPFTIEKLSKKEINQLEGYALSEKLVLMKKHGFSVMVRLQLLRKYFFRYFNFYQLIRNLYFGFLKA